MLKLVRHAVIKTVAPVVWKLSTRRKILALQQFSLIEKDSANQLFQCIKRIDDPQIKADLFQHVLEEFCHADLFDGLVKNYSESYLNEPVIPRENFLSKNAKKDEVIGFYSYAHVGESDVNEDFLIYGRAGFDNNIRKIFNRVGADENRHENDTGDILLKLCQGNKWLYRKYVLQSRTKRLWKQLESQLKNIGQLNLTLFLAVTYFLFGPFIYRSFKKRIVANPDEQLQILKTQLDDMNRLIK